MSDKVSLPRSPSQPKHEVARNAYLILRHAHDTADSLLRAFDTVRSVLGPTGKPKMGAPTDEEQDLLRAMVVFAGAGLDSMIKQLVRDVLPKLTKMDQQAAGELQKFAVRRLRREAEEEEASGVDLRFLAELLVSQKPGDAVVDALVVELTGRSLQSTDEIFRCLAHLGIGQADVPLNHRDLGPVFHCRNQIVHELDIDFSQPNRNRFPRKRTDMVRFATQLLDLSGRILSAVDKKLQTKP